jgi:2-aminoadipate transaminase
MPKGGFFVWATLPEHVETAALWSCALRHGVSFVGGQPFYVSESGANRMRLSFSYYPPDQIEEGIFRLGSAVKAYLSDASRENAG